MTPERDLTPDPNNLGSVGTLHGLLQVHRDMLRGRLFLHFGDPRIERLAGFIEGYRACLRANELPDPKYQRFCGWLRQSAQARPVEEDPKHYLLSAGGNHEEAIRIYLNHVSEFSALPTSKRAKIRRLGSATAHLNARAASRDTISYLLQLRQDLLQDQFRKHLADTNVERFGAFVDGYIACESNNYLEDKLYTLFRDWLRDVKHELSEEGWPAKYLRDCQGDHQQAILRYLDFAAEFAGAYKIGRFKALIKDYDQLVARRKRESTTRSQRFQDVCTAGLKLIEARLQVVSTQLRRWRDRFGSQAPTFDLFEAMGTWGKENRYSDLIAWLCKREDGIGESFALRLVSRMRPPLSDQGELGALLRIGREQHTGDGRIDLVLEFEKLAVAVEVKVWSSEHETPSSQPQTESYPKALARTLEAAGKRKDVRAVLLSPNGTQPLGTDASKLSFFDLAAAVLATQSLVSNPDEQVILRLFAAHLLEIAVQAGTGHSFWELSSALSSPRQDWPPWVILEAPALEKITPDLEASTS